MNAGPASANAPSRFTWGVATSSYQIEGAANEDGRGLSIWDTYSRLPGKIKNGDTGDIACDHYHRYREDVALIQEFGVEAYRFSVAWPRIMPEGRGAINEAGLAFYDRLVDALIAAGIEPWLCLYHWDLPQALQDKGGWTNRDCAQWFADYANVVAHRYGDRVKRFATFNEPSVFTLFGFCLGGQAPGIVDRSIERSVLDALLPPSGGSGVGLSWTGIVSQRWDWGTVHFNTATNLTPDQHGELFLDTIIEGPSKWKVRPVFEFYSDSVVNQSQTFSALVGAIWQVRDNLAFDVGLHYALVDRQPVTESRAGLTFGFPVSLGRPMSADPSGAPPINRR